MRYYNRGKLGSLVEECIESICESGEWHEVLKLRGVLQSGNGGEIEVVKENVAFNSLVGVAVSVLTKNGGQSGHFAQLMR